MHKSRLLFRQNGMVIRTHASMRLREWAFGVAGALIVVGMLALGNGLDASDVERAQVAEAASYARGYQAARDELLPSVTAAYERGMHDALRGAQSCKRTL